MNGLTPVALPGTLLDGRSLAAALVELHRLYRALHHVLAGAGHLFPMQQPQAVAAGLHKFLHKFLHERLHERLHAFRQTFLHRLREPCP